MIFLWKPCVRVNLGVHFFKCTWEEIYFQQSFSRRNHYLNTFQSVTCYVTTQKKKFSTNYFFSQCDQIRKKLRIRSHLLKKSLMKNFIFCPVRSECLERILLWTTFESYCITLILWNHQPVFQVVNQHRERKTTNSLIESF